MGVIRKTKSVKAVIHQFEQSSGAVSVTELAERLQQEMNRTTVYRILERLEDDGTLHSFIGKDGLKWYAKCKEVRTHHQRNTHPHFQCKECGKVECLTFDIAIPYLPDHKIDSAEFLLVGKCGECLLIDS